MWAKLTLNNAGKLADGYDSCGQGFDQMTIDGLGLERDEVIAVIRDRKPSYMEFEHWVVEHGNTSPDAIAKHNAAIRGYNHSDDLSSQMRKDSKCRDESVKDAVTLNTIEDLDELHKQATRG